MAPRGGLLAIGGGTVNLSNALSALQTPLAQVTQARVEAGLSVEGGLTRPTGGSRGPLGVTQPIGQGPQGARPGALAPTQIPASVQAEQRIGFGVVPPGGPGDVGLEGRGDLFFGVRPAQQGSQGARLDLLV